jgi:hypothetical protein
LDPKQFREYVVRPTLKYIGLWSEAAENLVVGTAIQESGLRYVDQTYPGPGPAYGVYQMERPTYNDHLRWVQRERPDLAAKLESLKGVWPAGVLQLHTNLAYGAAMCRLHYLRVKAPLPAANDIQGLAEYWKQYYNTPLGKGRPSQFVRAYRAAHP